MGEVVSLGERLRLHREELGISQAQAARELDVARTAYRLWEMEAAKPAPDRWRLISRWLGVSVATMLLAEHLIDEEEASAANAVFARLARGEVEWDAEGERQVGTFFEQERATILHQEGSGRLSEVESARLIDILKRVETEATARPTSRWSSGSMRKELPRDDTAPALARAAVLVTAAGAPSRQIEEAVLLTSELVTNSVQHPADATEVLSVEASVTSDAVRVAVADAGSGRIRPTATTNGGGWGFTIVSEIADRWGVNREGGFNVVWFELDLRQPGT